MKPANPPRISTHGKRLRPSRPPGPSRFPRRYQSRLTAAPALPSKQPGHVVGSPAAAVLLGARHLLHRAFTFISMPFSPSRHAFAGQPLRNGCSWTCGCGEATVRKSRSVASGHGPRAIILGFPYCPNHSATGSMSRQNLGGGCLLAAAPGELGFRTLGRLVPLQGA